MDVVFELMGATIKEKNEVILKFLRNEPVIQVISDIWVKKNAEGNYVEMTSGELENYSKGSR